MGKGLTEMEGVRTDLWVLATNPVIHLPFTNFGLVSLSHGTVLG